MPFFIFLTLLINSLHHQQFQSKFFKGPFVVENVTKNSVEQDLNSKFKKKITVALHRRAHEFPNTQYSLETSGTLTSVNFQITWSVC